MHDPDREPQYDAKAEAGILQLAEKPDVDNQRGAAYCLGDVIAPSSATLQTLFRLCASTDEQTATSALHSVAQIADRYKPAPVAELLEGTRAESPRVRQAAVHAIGNLSELSKPDRERCAARIIELLRDPGARAAACENIGFFSESCERFTPVLLELLKGELPNRAREAAIQSLGNAWLNTPPAPPAVLEAVRAATSHADPGVQGIAKWAVACLDRPATPPRPAVSTDEAKRHLAELEARGKRAVMTFFVAAFTVIAAIVAVFFSPPTAVALAVAAVVLLILWWLARKQAPSARDLMKAQLAISQSMLDDLKKKLE